MARILALTLAAFVAGCQPGGLQPVPFESLRLEASNETDVDLLVFVNGTQVGQIPPFTAFSISSAELPALPWNAEIKLRSGRTVLTLPVRAGDVLEARDGSGHITQQKGNATRVDLSCGRIDLWSGPPLAGPPPGPGSPGDCV
jgi:hypothetical protein